jgi:DNA-binding MarR family transcriptional regulator
LADAIAAGNQSWLELDENLNRIINANNAFLGKIRDFNGQVAATPAEAHLVESIHNHPDANANELARILGFTKSNISLRTAKLVEKGLVERYNRDHNRKEIFYRVTAKGQQLYDAHARFHADMSRPIYQKFLSFSSEQKEFLCRFLNEYAEYLDNYYLKKS